jgi:hypothetical protein
LWLGFFHKCGKSLFSIKKKILLKSKETICFYLPRPSTWH